MAEPSKQERYQSDSEIPAYQRIRSWVTLMLFLGMANAYVMRTNMSVAIVAMVNHSAIRDNNTLSKQHDGEFAWSYKLQGYILASFFYGYVLTQIPFGFLIKHYGARCFLGWGMLINSLASFLVPVAARKGGFIALCLVRLVQGLGEGPIVPCTHSMLARWIPPDERSRSGAAVYAGAQFGTIISMPLSGLLAVYGFDGGWPSIFYVFGAISTIWCICFLWLVKESPEQTSFISDAERKHIVESIWMNQQPDDTEKTPLCRIFSWLPFWAIMMAHLGQNYGYETLMTELPTYLSQIMKTNLKSNGLLSSLPYLAMWLTAMLFGILADALIKRGWSITLTRKLMNSIGQYGPAIMLAIVGFMDNELFITIALFTLGMGLNGGIYSGFKINHLDISPRYAGLLISITNCSANLVGLLAPMIAGHVIDSNPTAAGWRIVFLLAACVYVLSATFYLLFSSGEKQEL